MNEILKIIKSRRSIRSFTEQQIKEEDLQAILEAGQYAPNGIGNQPWHFIVVQNKELLEALSSASKQVAKNHELGFFRNLANTKEFNAFYGAPTVVIVAGDEQTQCSLADCAAATQNMLLAAEALGLGACWINFGLFIFDGEESAHYKQLLKVPEGFRPFYSVALGYRKGEVPKAAQRKEQVVIFI
ncbi:nitroreductase family protein [Pelosinus baikalensis]|uniref:Nitroreductase family protein n=1 Tax=Pelosinus baikalensis TaxID=2892015 RepID=A0ABS8HUR0_9FIRM|nr:nitroreductase family protein [Pelosinus baikalensis]MCC5466903.1 nitroreductase family protein [Pelosinus baikalensis]